MKKINIVFLLLLLTLGIFLYGCGEEAKDESFSIHTQAQADYLNGPYLLFKTYANGTIDISSPNSIHLEWTDKGKSEYTLYLSEDENFTNSKTYLASTNSIDIYNLKIHTTYYWKIDGIKVVNKFTITDEKIRNLYIDGITNVRDEGGFKIGENTYSNQGLLYRSSKLNDDESTTILISEKGINQLLDLGIKCELDLRTTADNENGGITTSPLGDSVKYISFPLESGGNIILLNKEKLADLFAILGNSENYPLLMHCSIGTDRTGCVGFLLNALLGVESDDLYYDYLFSNFGLIYSLRTKSSIDDYVKTVKRSGGDTLKEQVYNYLIDAGVNKSDIDNYINIMTK